MVGIGDDMPVKEVIVAIVGLILIVAPAISLALVYSYYRKYYVYMKKFHHETWESLMKKDSAVELIGEWYRWPFGSGYLIKSFFSKSSIDDDKNVFILKKKAILCVNLFAIMLIIAIIFIIFLN